MNTLPWTTPEEVVSRWTGSDAPELPDATVDTLIGDAAALIVQKYSNLQERIDNASLNVRLVQMVIANMVQRAYQMTHDGKTSYSWGTGPFSESGSYGDTKRGLFLTEQELDWLAPNIFDGKAFSVNLDNGKPNFNPSDTYNTGGPVIGSNVWFPATELIGREYRD